MSLLETKLSRLTGIREQQRLLVLRSAGADATIYAQLVEPETKIFQSDFGVLIDGYLKGDQAQRRKIESTLRGVFSIPGDFWKFVGLRERGDRKVSGWLEAVNMATNLGWKFVSAMYPEEADSTLLDKARLIHGINLFYRAAVSGYLVNKDTNNLAPFQSFLQFGRFLLAEPKLFGFTSLIGNQSVRSIALSSMEVLALTEWAEMGIGEGDPRFEPSEVEKQYIQGTLHGWKRMLCGNPDRETPGALEFFRTKFGILREGIDNLGPKFLIATLSDPFNFQQDWPLMVRRAMLRSFVNADAFNDEKRSHLGRFLIATPDFKDECLVVYNPSMGRLKARQEVLRVWNHNFDQGGDMGWLGLCVQFEWLVGNVLYSQTDAQLTKQNDDLRRQLMVVDGFLMKKLMIMTDLPEDNRVFGELGVASITYKPLVKDLSYEVTFQFGKGMSMTLKLDENNWKIDWGDDYMGFSSERSRLIVERIVLGYLAQQLDRRTAESPRTEQTTSASSEIEGSGGNGVIVIKANHIGWRNNQDRDTNGKKAQIDAISAMRLGMPIEKFVEIFRDVQLGKITLAEVKISFGDHVALAIVHYETRIVGRSRPEAPKYDEETGKLLSVDLTKIKVRKTDLEAFNRNGILPVYSLSIVIPTKLPNPEKEQIVVKSSGAAQRIIDESTRRESV